jgi:general secretion pathway protein K
MHARRSRDGFALLAVLWMLGGGVMLGALMLLTARDALGIATNRAALTQARWRAEGCIERARAAVDEDASDVIDDSTWMHLDGVVVRSPLVQECALAVEPAGTTLDVNGASDAQLRRLFVSAGLSAESADSVTSAILDWRDPDDDPRGSGAERPWYAAAGRAPPRNGAIGSPEQLATIRGLESRPAIDSLLGVEHDRIFLARAPLPVLASLPALTPAALAEVERRRVIGDSMVDLTRLAALVDSASREILQANASVLGELTTALPDAWIVAASASAGHPEVTARIEIRVVRSGRRLAIMRRRSDS